MKKKILIVLIALVAIVAIAMTAFKMMFSQEKPEYVQYNSEKVISDIKAQLEGIDIEVVREKESLIVEKGIDEI